jgi:hypothetical protein
LVVQEEKLKRPLSDIESWGLSKLRPEPKDGKSYYGNSEDDLNDYKEGYLRAHPDTPDPMKAPTDERVVVGLGPKLHGQQKVLDQVVTPSISYTRLRAIDPSVSQRTSTPARSQSQSLLTQQTSVSIFPLIFLFAHLIFRIEMLYEFIMSYCRPTWSTHARRTWRGRRELPCCSQSTPIA